MTEHAVYDGARSKAVCNPVTQSAAGGEVQLSGLLVDDEDIVFLFFYQRIVGGILQYLFDGCASFRLQSPLCRYAHGKAQTQGVCIAFPFFHISQVDEVLSAEILRCSYRTETRGYFFQLVKYRFINIFRFVIRSVRAVYIISQRQGARFGERHISENIHRCGKKVVQLHFGCQHKGFVLCFLVVILFIVQRFHLAVLHQCRVQIIPLPVYGGGISGTVHAAGVTVTECLCILAYKLRVETEEPSVLIDIIIFHFLENSHHQIADSDLIDLGRIFIFAVEVSIRTTGSSQQHSSR